MPTIAEDAGNFIKLKLDEKRKLVDTFIQEHKDLIARSFDDPETFNKFALDLVKLELDILTGHVPAAKTTVERVDRVRAAFSVSGICTGAISSCRYLQQSRCSFRPMFNWQTKPYC